MKMPNIQLSFKRFFREADWKAFTIFLIIMGFFFFFLFLPILYVFRGALFPDGLFNPIYFSLMFRDPFYLESIINSIEIGIATTILASLISIPMAYIMVRYDFQGKRILQGLLLVPLVST